MNSPLRSNLYTIHYQLHWTFFFYYIELLKFLLKDIVHIIYHYTFSIYLQFAL